MIKADRAGNYIVGNINLGDFWPSIPCVRFSSWKTFAQGLFPRLNVDKKVYGENVFPSKRNGIKENKKIGFPLTWHEQVRLNG